MSRAQLAHLLGRLTDAFPSMAHRAERIRSWTGFLADRDFDVADQAVADVLATSSRAPSVAVLADSYGRVEAAQRREQLRIENETELPEPSADERERVLQEMRAYVSDRWGTR